MDTQTQIDRLIELAIIQRSELKQLVEQLPQLREHLNAEVEKVFDETEPQLRAELEEWTTKQTADKTAALGVALEAKIADLAKSLEVSTQARYNAIIAEREENARLAAQAEAKIAEHAASLPSAVKDIVTAELARFPRAGEIDQLRKEFAEPRGLNPRGKWQAGETYNKLDLVTINGDSYTSNTDGNRTRPSRSSADWTLVAARGTGGGGGPTSLSELTTVPSDGDVLIGSGTSWVTSNLTAGAGISITVGPGAITISATDGDITLDDGTAASPSLHFTNDADTGIYRPAANTLGISTSGVQRMYVDENGITTVGAGGTFDGSVHAANGNANNPSFSFTSDEDTGFFRHAANEIGIALGGTQYATLTSTTFSITPVVTMASSLRVNGTTDSSSKDTGAIVTEGGLGVEKSATIGGNLTVSGGTLAVTPSANDATATLKGRATGTNQLATSSRGSNVTLVNLDTTDNNCEAIAFQNSNELAIASIVAQNVSHAGRTGKLYVNISNGAAPAEALNIAADKTVTLAGNLTVSGTGNNIFNSGGGNVLIGTTTDGGQKLQVAGTVAKTAAGPTTIAIASNEAYNLRDEGRLFIVGNASAGSRYLGLEYYDVGNGAYRNVAAVPNGGNFLVGTTVDSSALLQVGTNTTTAAGGMKFGTDTSLYRSAAYTLKLDGGNNVTSFRVLGSGSCEALMAVTSASSVLFGSTTAGASTVLCSGNGTTALTLDSSQNATFAGKVTAGTWADVVSARLGVATSANSYTATIANNASSGGSYALRLHTTGTASSDYIVVGSSGASAGSIRFLADGAGNFVVNNAAIATTATDGFLYVSTCAGTPTGTPTSYTGRAPIVVDTTNNKLYFYSGGAWRNAGP